MFFDAQFESYLSQISDNSPSELLTRDIVLAMGGADALHDMHLKISRTGVNSATINEDWGDLHRSWNQSCVDIFTEHKDECIAVTKSWFIQWGQSQDAIKVIQALINKDIAREVKRAIESSQNDKLQTFEYYRDADLIMSYDRDDILLAISNDKPLLLVEQELRCRVAEKFVNCVCVAICSYYSGFLVTNKDR